MGLFSSYLSGMNRHVKLNGEVFVNARDGDDPDI